MAGQLFGSENPGAYWDDFGVGETRRFDIFGRVTDETNPSRLAQPTLRFLHGLAENVRPAFVAVAEAAKAEKIAQASRFDLEPADRLEISRCQAEQFAGGFQFGEHLRNCGADCWFDAASIGRNISADNFQRCRKVRFESVRRDPSALQSCT